MRCSICDRSDTRFIYNNWHCFACEDSIRQAVGDLHEEDIQKIVSGDNDNDFEFSVDDSDYSSCVDEKDT